MLKRPFPRPKTTANAMAPATEGAVGMSRNTAADISVAAMMASLSGGRFTPKSMFVNLLSTCEGPKNVPTSAAVAPSPRPESSGTM